VPQQSIRRAQALLLGTAIAAALIAGAALAMQDILNRVLDLSNPGGFSLVRQLSSWADQVGTAALISLLLLLVHDDEELASAPGWPLAEVAAWLCAGNLGLRILFVALGGTTRLSWLIALARLCCLVAVCLTALVTLRKHPPSRWAMRPHLAWRLVTLLVGGVTLAFALVTHDNFTPGHWLRLLLYPAAFATCWTVWHRQRAVSEDTGRLALLGVIIYLPAALFLLYEEALGDPANSDMKAAFILSCGAVGLNALALLVPATRRLLTQRQGRLICLSLLVGLLTMAAATMPRIVPPWEVDPRGLVNRIGILADQSMVGFLLIMGGAAVGMLRRRDPAGLISGLHQLFLLLTAAGYLLSVALARWIWSHEIWVQKVQYLADVHMRQAVVGAWPTVVWIGLLSLVPVTYRVAAVLVRRGGAVRA